MFLEEDGGFGELKHDLAAAGNLGCSPSYLPQPLAFRFLPYQRIRFIFLRVRVKLFQLLLRKQLVSLWKTLPDRFVIARFVV